METVIKKQDTFFELMYVCETLIENGTDNLLSDIQRLYSVVEEMEGMPYKAILFTRLILSVEGCKMALANKEHITAPASSGFLPLYSLSEQIANTAVDLFDELIYLLSNDPESSKESNYRMLNLMKLIYLIESMQASKRVLVQ